MRWTDAGHRAPYGCGNTTSFSTEDQRGGMNLIPPIRTLRVLVRAPHLFAWNMDGSLSSPSPTTLSAALFLRNPLLRACRHRLGYPAQPGRTFTPFLPPN